ncbi:LemA family protein [bacterium]|nr:LemA family protein [bacterium]
MKKRSWLILLLVLGCIAGIVLIFVIWGVSVYNKIIALDQDVQNQWAQVETQLQRRYDLIDNLVETVKGYASHERETFLGVTQARSRVSSAGSIAEKIEAENQLSSALSRLLVVVENYPELKANENFIRLQDELAGTENRIAVARKRYNDAVKTYNTFIKVFPNNLIAGLFGKSEPKEFFGAPEVAKEAPKVKF